MGSSREVKRLFGKKARLLFTADDKRAYIVIGREKGESREDFRARVEEQLKELRHADR